ncbi:ABC transporter substrate-binding protein [Bradyrhizobium manausense]|uniref:ABC transporter substrate-binding protein n=1 Tax=Bradyrhizobium manausense TaxID=989370 RepID=UPI001BA91078|nr:ABC transporter substrate-binding protein [Bradyrhizobium manausense]MBR0724202.1 ABC transporter substrate-binding protein [Bradyrhizobium manausense]
MIGFKRSASGARMFGSAAAVALLTMFSAGAALGQGGAVKIGHLTDMNSAFSDVDGKYGLAATQMAVEDFGGTVLGKKIEVVSADHQNKPSVGSAIAAEWFDRDNVDVITGLPGSSVALAVQEIARSRPAKALIQAIAQSPDLAGSKCIPNAVHWSPDAYALGVALTRYATEHKGKTSFVFVPDNAVGEALRRSAEAGVTAGGGKLLGSVRVPVASGDVSSYLLQAQGSGADNIVLTAGGSDMINVVKTAQEFGLIAGGKNLLAVGLFTTDLMAIGLHTAQGIIFSTPFYPGLNPEAAAWAKRFEERTGVVPSFSHVADYEAITHYLKAVKVAGTTDASVVIPKMREIPAEGFALSNAKILANNQLVRDIYIGKVKAPGASSSKSDYMELLGTVPALDAFLPIKDSECPLVKAAR